MELSQSENKGFFGERVFSGNALKYFAALLMVFDHLHEFFFQDAVWMNILGRMVLPIFMFMVAEGFHYTRSRRNYMLQLFAGFCVMNTLNIVFSVTFPVEGPALANNVFATMFVAALYMLGVDFIREGISKKKAAKIIGGIGLMLGFIALSAAGLAAMDTLPRWFLMGLGYIPNLLALEGGFTAVIMGVLFYIFRKKRLAQLLVLIIFGALGFYNAAKTGFVNIQWMMVFAVIPLLMYNGKRGRGGKFSKWFFYIFYPVHIYLMYFILYFTQTRV